MSFSVDPFRRSQGISESRANDLFLKRSEYRPTVDGVPQALRDLHLEWDGNPLPADSEAAPNWATMPALTYDDDTGEYSVPLAGYASGADSFGLGANPPVGFTFSETGVLTTNSDVIPPGEYDVPLVATNENDSTPTTIRVVIESINAVPVVSLGAIPPPTEGKSFVVEATITDPDEVDFDTERVTATFGGLAPTLAALVDNEDGTATLTLTWSSAPDAGSRTLSVQYTDEEDADSNTATATVQVAAAGADIDITVLQGQEPGSITGLSSPVYAQAPSLDATHALTLALVDTGFDYYVRYLDAGNWVKAEFKTNAKVVLTQKVGGVQQVNVLTTAGGTLVPGLLEFRMGVADNVSDPDPVQLWQGGSQLAVGTTLVKQGLKWGTEGHSGDDPAPLSAIYIADQS